MSVIPFRPAVKRVSIVVRDTAQHPALFPDLPPPAGPRLDAQLDALRDLLSEITQTAQVNTARESDALQLVAHALDVLLVERLGGVERDEATPQLLAAIRDVVARLGVSP
jgi:hypothetical protein